MPVLDGLVSDAAHSVPVKLLANRLALKAATATSKLEGRLAREADIRDAYHLTQPGEARGQDGDLLAGCVSVMRAVLEVDDRAERIACLLSDVVLARAMNWKSILPASALYLTKATLRDLISKGQRADLAVQQRILESVKDTIRLAYNLTLSSAALLEVAPKLRAKGSEAAVAMFLSEDAVAPSTMLSPMIQGTTTPMTDRAARRFCDRLVELGVAHELTGRSTFRLYGIAL